MDKGDIAIIMIVVMFIFSLFYMSCSKEISRTQNCSISLIECCERIK